MGANLDSSVNFLMALTQVHFPEDETVGIECFSGLAGKMICFILYTLSRKESSSKVESDCSETVFVWDGVDGNGGGTGLVLTILMF